jgi:hypothetical protein
MSIAEQVSAFIGRRALRPICDACIADHLAIRRTQVTTAASKKKTTAGAFLRAAGQCSGCCTRRVVNYRA